MPEEETFEATFTISNIIDQDQLDRLIDAINAVAYVADVRVTPTTKEDRPMIADRSVRRPTIAITRDQLESWAGRLLSDEEVGRLESAIPHSSVPDAIGTICENLTTP